MMLTVIAVDNVRTCCCQCYCWCVMLKGVVDGVVWWVSVLHGGERGGAVDE